MSFIGCNYIGVYPYILFITKNVLLSLKMVTCYHRNFLKDSFAAAAAVVATVVVVVLVFFRVSNFYHFFF